jgi:hypothetical protein
MAGLLAQVGVNPQQSMGAVRDAESLINSTTNPELAAQQGKISAAFAPAATFNKGERDARMNATLAASQAEAIAVQQEKNKGSLAEAFQMAGLPGAAKAQAGVDQMELNRQAEGIKAGAEWAMKVPFDGGFLDEGQAYQLSQAARAANPTLNPQDAIVKFVKDNPKLLKGNWEMIGKNQVDIPGGIPTTVPAAPVAPAAAAPAAQTAKPLTKQDVAAMPDGSIIVVQGQQYRKQGGQLVKVK